MRRQRTTEGFNLAFLDIMSCGLGAIVLVFMLVKHNVEAGPETGVSLRDDLRQLQAQKANLSDTKDRLESEISSEEALLARLQSDISRLEERIRQAETERSGKTQSLAEIKETIEATPPLQTEDVIETEGAGEETYLMGLRVEGQRIAVLVDHSASMADEKLIDVIRTKSGSDREKRNAPKWQRTKRVVQWLLARMPRSADVGVIAFNDKVKLLATGMGPANDEAHLRELIGAIEALIPTGPTNLQLALDKVRSLRVDHIYLITDGLPTVGQSSYGSLNPFAECSSLLGRASTISGACRVKLFRQTLKDSEPGGVRINVVLLPLEGDPQAANEYWSWTARTGGLVISPAKDWP